MSSGFISEAELAERRRVRQEEWEKVRQPGQPEEVPEEEFDHRSLFDRLQEQKQKKDLEYEEAHKLKNMIKGLDDDEVEFLDLVDRSKMEEERRKTLEEAREINDFRNAVASLKERSLEEKINTEIRSKPVVHPGSASRNSQQKLLRGAVRKRSAENVSPESEEKKKQKVEEKCEVNGKESSSNSATTLEESGKTSHKRKERDEDQNEETGITELSVPQSALQCIGILPGLGTYNDSSDSDRSSDSDVELPSDASFDLLGRKVVTATKPTKKGRA